MRIEYSNNLKDLFIFFITNRITSPIIQGVLAVTAVFNFFFEIKRLGVMGALIAAIIYYLLFWFLILFLMIFELFLKRKSQVLSRHIIEIQEENLYEETEFNKSYFKWAGLLKVVSRPGVILVYIASNMAHIIPNRAFESKEHRAGFLNLLQEKIKNSRKNT